MIDYSVKLIFGGETRAYLYRVVVVEPVEIRTARRYQIIMFRKL